MLRMLLFVLALSTALFGGWGCKSTQPTGYAPPVDTARWAIGKLVELYGGDLYYRHDISFRSRERQYAASFDRAGYRYERRVAMMGQQMIDALDPSGLVRKVDGELISMTPSDREEAANTLHQVIFFALLPHFLRDTAITTEYLGQATLVGQSYYRVKLGFRRAEGGRSLSDEYLCWIRTEGFTLDYLAYTFARNGGGARFLRTLGSQTVSGISFNDYESYTDADGNRNLLQLAKLFEAGALQSLAKVELQDIRVTPKRSDP